MKSKENSLSSVSKLYIVVGLLSQTTLVIALFLGIKKHLYDSRTIINLVSARIVDLYQSQPNNPLAQFLFWNNKSIVDACKTVHNKMIMVDAIILGLVALSLLLLFSYTYRKKITERKRLPSEERKRKEGGRSTNIGYFSLGFMAGSAITTMVCLIPFLLIPDKRLCGVLSFAFQFHGLKSNPLAKVLEGMIKETFSDTPIFEAYALKTQTCLVAAFIASTIFLLVIALFLCRSSLSRDKVSHHQKCEARTALLEDTEISSAESQDSLTSTLCTP